MNNLKPCPFCGGEATICVSDGSGSVWTKDLETTILRGRRMTHCFAMCKKCRIRTQSYLTRRGMFNAWNRRASDA